MTRVKLVSSPYFLVLLCTHYGPLQCFSKYFRKLKEIGVLWPIFPDYVISCDYDLIDAAKFELETFCKFSLSFSGSV